MYFNTGNILSSCTAVLHWWADEKSDIMFTCTAGVQWCDNTCQHRATGKRSNNSETEDKEELPVSPSSGHFKHPASLCVWVTSLEGGGWAVCRDESSPPTAAGRRYRDLGILPSCMGIWSFPAWSGAYHAWWARPKWPQLLSQVADESDGGGYTQVLCDQSGTGLSP